MKIPAYSLFYIQLDKALENVKSKLKSNRHTTQHIAQSLEYVENLYYLVESSPHLLSVVVSKLIDKNYAGQ